jgi:hypothetical protein
MLQCGSGVMSGTLTHRVYNHQTVVALAAVVAAVVLMKQMKMGGSML